jgi:hypothetical protein
MANVVQRPDSTYPVVVKPYKLDISQFGEKVRDKMKFTIKNVSDQDIKLELIAGMPGYAEIDLPDEIKAGFTGAGEIRLEDEVLATNFEKSFTFQVNDEASSRFTLPVKRTVRDPDSESAQADTKGTK